MMNSEETTTVPESATETNSANIAKTLTAPVPVEVSVAVEEIIAKGLEGGGPPNDSRVSDIVWGWATDGRYYYLSSSPYMPMMLKFTHEYINVVLIVIKLYTTVSTYRNLNQRMGLHFIANQRIIVNCECSSMIKPGILSTNLMHSGLNRNPVLVMLYHKLLLCSQMRRH
jgi:hypothetical protein